MLLIPWEDEKGNIIYEEMEVHHRDGTVTTETGSRLKEIYYTDEQIKQFFELSYKFLSERYGEKNVISAYVHKDETTPHMHFLFIPIVDDKKRNEKHSDKEPAYQSVADANEQVKQVQSEIVNMQEAKLITEEDMEKWLEELEKKNSRH